MNNLKVYILIKDYFSLDIFNFVEIYFESSKKEKCIVYLW